MNELTTKDHPSFKIDPEYSWDKIPKNSFDVPHQKMQVPDWRIYKIEGIRELEYIRDTLAAKGLKDPWLRNEVWRYPTFWHRNPMRTYGKFLFGIKQRGLKYGFCLTVGICSLEYLYYKKKYGGYPPYITTLYQLLFGGPTHH